MFENLSTLEHKLDELNMRLSDPSVLKDPALFKKLSKEHASLLKPVKAYNEYKSCENRVREAKEILDETSDPELRELAKEELSLAQEELEEKIATLNKLLEPKDEKDSLNAYMEIRGGAGGDEAALFAADLYRMYTRYAERSGWKTEVVSYNENELGGFKEIVFLVEGDDVYGHLKFESGVHRVQRIPVTESGGRIHTSTATVAVMPEVDDSIDIQIDPGDLRIDTYRSSGAGGQHINKTSSAIRITHLPTGIVVQCQNERSQFQNKDKAMEMLRSKLYQMELEKQQAENTQERRGQIGTGDRSEKIRTYNYPQSRVTDHRIKFNSHRLESILDGDLDEIVTALTNAASSEALAASGEEE